MGTVIFGHGGLDPISANDMEWVAIPTGTTLQFYADTGQALAAGRTTWSQFAAGMQQPWPALDSTRVSYNLKLYPLSADEQRMIDGLGTDFPHTIVMAGRDIGETQLCNGDSTTCPSDPRMITGAVAGPRTHGCTGLLATYAGHELHWIACTVTQGFDATSQGAVDAARGTAPETALHGADPDSIVSQAQAYLRDYPDHFATWFDALPAHDRDELLRDPGFAAWNNGRTFTTEEWAPSQADLQAVADVNQPYVKGLGDDEEGTWEVGGFLVLLGDQHNYTDWVRRQHDHAQGTFSLARATFGAGKIVFTGVPAAHQGTITAAVELFSDKTVKFE